MVQTKSRKPHFIFDFKGSGCVVSICGNIIVTGDDWKEQVLSQTLAKDFEMKTLGKLKYFLGLTPRNVFSYHNKNVTNLLQDN